MGGKERRQSTRVEFQTTADLQFDEQKFLQCETTNLSVKGVFVLGITGKDIGEECSVKLHLSGASSELLLRMQGTVVRIQQDGIAINFHEIDLDSFYHLKNIVYYNSENPDELEVAFDPDLPARDNEQEFE